MKFGMRSSVVRNDLVSNVIVWNEVVCTELIRAVYKAPLNASFLSRSVYGPDSNEAKTKR